MGIPEEVLTDQGTQIMSECTQEVSRLLSIKGLTSTLYHPICNGLVATWNPEVHAEEALPRPTEAVAQNDQPCCVCYREVSQEWTGFSPFQLLYGRTFSQRTWNDPKELWIKEVNIHEVKSSYEYVTELGERLEDSQKLAKEELEKSQKCY